jgi:hypothetical protein
MVGGGIVKPAAAPWPEKANLSFGAPISTRFRHRVEKEGDTEKSTNYTSGGSHRRRCVTVAWILQTFGAVEAHSRGRAASRSAQMGVVDHKGGRCWVVGARGMLNCHNNEEAMCLGFGASVRGGSYLGLLFIGLEVIS